MFLGDKCAARVGDPIDAGGSILSSDAHVHVDGKLVATVGSRAYCAVHGMTYVAEGSGICDINGKAVAVDGDRLACGHRIVVQGNAGESAQAAAPAESQTARFRHVSSLAPIPAERRASSAGRPSSMDLSQYLKIIRPDGTPLPGASFLKWTECGAAVEGKLSDDGTSPPISSDRAGFVHYLFEAPQAEAC